MRHLKNSINKQLLRLTIIHNRHQTTTRIVLVACAFCLLFLMLWIFFRWSQEGSVIASLVGSFLLAIVADYLCRERHRHFDRRLPKFIELKQNHDLARALGVAASRIATWSAEQASSKKQKTFMLRVARRLEIEFVDFLSSYQKDPIVRNLLDDEALVTIVLGRNNQRLSERHWREFLDLFVAESPDEDKRGISAQTISKSLDLCAKELALELNFIFREVLKHAFSDGEEAWAAYQLALAQQILDRVVRLPETFSSQSEQHKLLTLIDDSIAHAMQGLSDNLKPRSRESAKKLAREVERKLDGLRHYIAAQHDDFSSTMRLEVAQNRREVKNGNVVQVLATAAIGAILLWATVYLSSRQFSQIENTSDKFGEMQQHSIEVTNSIAQTVKDVDTDLSEIRSRVQQVELHISHSSASTKPVSLCSFRPPGVTKEFFVAFDDSVKDPYIRTMRYIYNGAYSQAREEAATIEVDLERCLALSSLEYYDGGNIELAIEWMQQATDIDPTNHKNFARLSALFYRTRNYSQATDAVRMAMELSNAQGDYSASNWHNTLFADLMWAQGYIGEAINAYVDALQSFLNDQPIDWTGAGAAQMKLGQVAMFSPDASRSLIKQTAEECFTSAAEYFAKERKGSNVFHREMWANCEMNLARVAARQGKTSLAKVHVHKAASLFRDAANLVGECEALSMIALLTSQQPTVTSSEWQDSLDLLNEAYITAKASNDALAIAGAAYEYGAALSAQPETCRKSVELLRIAVNHYTACGDEYRTAYSRARLGTAIRRCSNEENRETHTAAIAEFELAIDGFERVGANSEAAAVLLDKAITLDELESDEIAVAGLAEQALELVGDNSPYVAASAELLLAAMSRHQPDRRSERNNHYKKAFFIYRSEPNYADAINVAFSAIVDSFEYGDLDDSVWWLTVMEEMLGDGLNDKGVRLARLAIEEIEKQRSSGVLMGDDLLSFSEKYINDWKTVASNLDPLRGIRLSHFEYFSATTLWSKRVR